MHERSGESATGSLEDEGRVPSAVVGIGGSAGGLAAFAELLESLPSDTGMAFVIVSHLDPGHPSLLTHLLVAKSAMPVTEAVDDARVVADHVYVLPPGSDMTISQGHLKLEARATAGRHLPIDVFLESLAVAHGQTAIGVILTGAASDGTRGMAAIKAAGGLTLAQDPASAEHPSMPASAIEAGAVDFILPLELIAPELAAIAGHGYVNGGRDAALASLGEQEEAAFEEIFGLLRTALAVDFSAYKRPTIRRRVARRMLTNHFDDLRQYVSYLHEHPAELEALYGDILISVTEFFRDREMFGVLRDRVLPAILRDKAEGSAVRLWVPGCASGEEAYSLAITVLEAMEQLGISRPLKVFATDIGDRELETARKALYPQGSVAAVSPELLQRFFVSSDGGYRVNKAVREHCVFARHDLTRDPPLARIDLVSCRNLLIYLSPALQRRVVPKLHYALLPGGCLVLGISESLGGFSQFFEAVDGKRRVFTKNSLAAPSDASWVSAQTGAVDAAPGLPGRAGPASDLQRATERVLLDDFLPAGVTVDARLEIVRFHGAAATFVGNPPGRPTRRVLDMVSADLAGELRGLLEEVTTTGERAVRRRLSTRSGGDIREVNLHVVPIETGAGERYFIVLFEDLADGTVSEDTGRPAEAGSGGDAERLQRELVATRARLEALLQDKETVNDELRAANEEILSASEEIQSVNEELETSSEELQSTNEELSSRNAELGQLSDDLHNLLTSVNLPIVLVDREGHIRRITPEAHRLFRVTPGDLGRPVAELAQRLGIDDLDGLVREVVQTLHPLERALRDDAGRWYVAHVRPYATADHRIEGAVVTLIDTDDLTRRYEAQLRIASVLQASFVHALPKLEGLELAALSLPASRPELVGGDFCDVVRLSDGAVMVLIGDVQGKGLRAAGLTETVRSAARALSLVLSSPEQVLATLNRLLLQREDAQEEFVTALLLRIDPASGEVLFLSAGHPPPMLISASGSDLLETSYGLPLGAFDTSFEVTRARLLPGDTLVLYTDGLTEARNGAELFGERRLLEAAAALQGRPPREIVESLSAAATDFAGSLNDDLQLLAVRFFGIDP